MKLLNHDSEDIVNSAKIWSFNKGYFDEGKGTELLILLPDSAKESKRIGTIEEILKKHKVEYSFYGDFEKKYSSLRLC